MADLSGYYPTSPAPSQVDIKTTSPGLITNTLSGKALRTSYGGQYYEFTLKYAPMRQVDFRPIHGFIAQAYGPNLSFEVILPEISYTTSPNPPSTTPATSASAARGAKQVTLSNCGANKTVLTGGDYFKFNNHSKVYQATNTCVANSSGVATLFFAGSLVTAVNSGVDLTLDAVPFTMIFTETENEVQTNIGGISTMNIGMREVW
jgi:hypothetical protein